VGLDDFDRFLRGYHGDSAAAWVTGDFDYSGAVGAEDFNLYLRGLVNQERPNVTGELFAALSEFVRDEGLNVNLSAVPEPSTLGLIMLAASTALLRARKRHPAVH
jgi:hypothetical protein